MVRAVVNGVQPDILGGEALAQAPMYLVEVGFGEEAARQPRLIGDDDEPKADPPQRAQPRRDAVVEPQIFGARGIVAWVNQGSVPIQKDCPRSVRCVAAICHDAPPLAPVASSCSAMSQRM